MNCSFIEPPSVVEQPSPSWSSRGSFSSFDTTDEGPVYCVPHEGEWTLGRVGRARSLMVLLDRMIPTATANQSGLSSSGLFPCHDSPCDAGGLHAFTRGE